MWKSFICRHWDVEWLDSHRCNCSGCGKYGHYFEDGYVIWTRASRRPLEAEDAEVYEFGFDFEPTNEPALQVACESSESYETWQPAAPSWEDSSGGGTAVLAKRAG